MLNHSNATETYPDAKSPEGGRFGGLCCILGAISDQSYLKDSDTVPKPTVAGPPVSPATRLLKTDGNRVPVSKLQGYDLWITASTAIFYPQLFQTQQMITVEIVISMEPA